MIIEIFIAVLAILLVYMTIHRLYKKDDIPGPFPLPLIGNLHQLSSTPYKDFRRWRKTFGDVFRVYLGTAPAIVVNSIELSREALVKKGKYFENRPCPIPFLTSFVEGESSPILRNVSPRLWKQRKHMHSAVRLFGPTFDGLVTAIHKEVDDLLSRFQKMEGEEIDPMKQMYFTISNIIIQIVFGKRYEWDDPHFLEYVNSNKIILGSIEPDNWMNLFPFLRFIPGSGFKRIAEAVKLRDDILSGILENHRKTFDRENIRDMTDSLIKAQMEEEEADSRNTLSDRDLIMTMDNFVIGGTDTTAVTMCWCLIFMMRNPKVQSKIQNEMDNVIGRERRPEFKERGDLPYLEATIAEALRLSALSPLGFPRTTTDDTTLGGYKIAAGTDVIFNLWELHRDPECWKSPNEFKPERFLDQDGKYISPLTMSWLPFSAGRRVCPGENLAKIEVFYILSGFLQKYTVENPPNQPVPDQVEGVFKQIHIPKPFKILIKKREKV